MNASQRDVERCFECGMKEYLSKPLLRDKLIQILEKYK